MLVQAWRDGLANYTNFHGHASRPQFWYWVLAQFLIFLVLGLFENFVLNPALGLETAVGEEPARPLSALYALGTFIPSIAITVRRLRDAAYSPWLAILGLIPFVNLVLIYFCAQPSAPKTGAEA
jgi:uncharacterized membrane protein YhaH (DUF805 family)